MAQINGKFNNYNTDFEVKFKSAYTLVSAITNATALNDIYVNLTAGIYASGRNIEIYSYETTLISPLVLGVTVFYKLI